MPRIPEQVFPPEPTLWQQVERNMAAKAELTRLKAVYRKCILADREAERQAHEARLAEHQAESEREVAAGNSEDEGKDDLPAS